MMKVITADNMREYIANRAPDGTYIAAEYIEGVSTPSGNDYAAYGIAIKDGEVKTLVDNNLMHCVHWCKEMEKEMNINVL